MSDRVDISRVEVIDVERSPSNPFYEEWTGSIQLDDTEFTFTSNKELNEGESYRVVWERTDPLGGEQIFVIHKVVDNGT